MIFPSDLWMKGEVCIAGTIPEKLMLLPSNEVVKAIDLISGYTGLFPFAMQLHSVRAWLCFY